MQLWGHKSFMPSMDYFCKWQWVDGKENGASTSLDASEFPCVSGGGWPKRGVAVYHSQESTGVKDIWADSAATKLVSNGPLLLFRFCPPVPRSSGTSLVIYRNKTSTNWWVRQNSEYEARPSPWLYDWHHRLSKQLWEHPQLTICVAGFLQIKHGETVRMECGDRREWLRSACPTFTRLEISPRHHENNY